MARKKKETGSSGGNAPWLNTFADLMNLLLCFFVMLFAMSTISEEKFEELSISMANTFGVFDNGGSSVGRGQLISSGMSQLNELDAFFNTLGKTVEGDDDTSDITNTEQGVEGESGSDGVMKDNEGLHEERSIQSAEGNVQEINQALETLKEEMKQVTTGMYDKASDLMEQYNMRSNVELNLDPEYRYVEFILKGNVLYDSGEAELKREAKPFLNKIGDILQNFGNSNIEIIGHTDNVPMTSKTYKDNNWLSSARALNAAEYLIKECGIEPARLKYSGRGEYEPIASNATEDGRVKNRRIEIRIYNKYSSIK